MQRPFYLIVGVILWLMSLIPIHAETGDEPPIITPNNVHLLSKQMIIGSGQINGIAYSPDGQHIAIANTSGVWLYPANNIYANPILLEGHTDPIKKVIFSPSGRRLAGIGRYGIIVWYLPTGELSLSWHVGVPISDAFFDSNELRLLAISDYSDEIWVWSVRDGMSLGNIDDKEISSMSLNPDDSFLIMTSPDSSSLFLYDLLTLDDIGEISVSQNSIIEQLIFSDDGRYFATRSNRLVSDTHYDSYILIWDATLREILAEIPHENKIDWIDFSHDGHTILSAWENNISIWDVVSGQLVHLINGLSAIEQAIFDPTGNYILSLNPSNEITVWDAQNLAILQSRQFIPIEKFHLIAEDSQLVTNHGDIFDVMTGEWIMNHPDSYSPPASEALELAQTFVSICANSNCIANLNPTKTQIAIGVEYDTNLQIWDIATRQQIHNLNHAFEDDFAYGQLPKALAYSPDGQLIAVSVNNAIHIWDTQTGSLLTTLTPTRGTYIHQVQFNQEGTRLFSVSDDLVVQVWQVHPVYHQATPKRW